MQKDKKRILVTSALPYANGSIHIGHLVEYIQTDVLVRALRLAGEDVIFCCADDTHGTAIEINAKKKGITPEKFIDDCYKEHTRDFESYHIKFDSYYSTNSPENKHYSEEIFNALKAKGHIYTKDIELTYCEKCKRFLPDRYVKGKCPKCGAPDQYGDSCEACGSAYKTIDLIEPFCVTCKSTPVRKMSNHYFFKLSNFADRLEKYLNETKGIQPEIRNQVMNWVKNGLEDWNISRDGPYFGFKIPGEENKYFYVWLDAPIGYIASTANYCATNKNAKAAGLTTEDYWKKPGSEIIHIIGKDIIYFHLLFWPAVLMGAGYNLPDTINVHGFLTVNGEKMSKSRGTFLNASEFLPLSNPEFLRYYYAANLTRQMNDLNLDLSDYKERVNNELVANVANFFYRVLSFCNKNFDSEVLPAEESFLKRFDYAKIIESYRNLEFREALKHILSVSSEGNKYFQDNAPWKLIKEDKAKAQQVVSNCVNLVRDVNTLLKPILPVFTKSIEKQLGLGNDISFADLSKNLGKHKIAEAEIIFRNMEKLELKAKDPFSFFDLRVAEVKSCKSHPNADKLIVLGLELGNGEERTICAGIRPYYTDEEMVGKHIIIVYNLKPAMLRGIESRGMLLAASASTGVKVITVENSKPGDSVYAEGVEKQPKKEITIDEFAAVEIATNEKGNVEYDGHLLRTDKELAAAKGVAERAKVK
jgi:methionyl-tRNA synthetase